MPLATWIKRLSGSKENTNAKVINASTAPPLARPQYPGAPLSDPGNEFRLLYLRPSHSRFDSDVQCTLSNVSPGPHPPYEALSYTWGHSDNHRTIRLNHVGGFPVTDNLYGALKQLRYENAVRILWVDALCIDQGNDIERSAQVGRTGETYSRSSRLMVWLGDVSRGDFFSSAPAYYQDQKQAFHGAIRKTHPSWWSRKWVAQEFVKAPYPPTFYFGEHQATLGYVLQTTKDANGLTASHLRTSLLALMALRDATNGLTRRMELFDAIQLTLRMEVTDPRDHVYILLGLETSKPMASRIQPDYSLSASQVFAQATYHIICETQTLTVLG